MKLLIRVLALLMFVQVATAQEIDDGDKLLNRPAERTYDIILDSCLLYTSDAADE